ncbi:MAG: HAD family phosphatase [Lachnospiraceae bacterium]|nr:HAD family phosphatase [Lachnospiraceae bacterium]
MINAVIFDMDGLLINTEKYLFRFWKQAAAEAGYDLSDEQLLGIRSLAAEFAIPRFREIMGAGFDYTAIRNRRKELMSDHLEQNGVEKKPGVEILLQWLTEHGYKKAVATATDMERTRKYLSEIGILEQFDQIVCAPSVPHGKPMPDVYLHACAQIGERPENCVALEDSDNGALSAYRAGCKVIMVPDLAEPLPETEEFLTGVAENLEAVIPLLQKLEA